MLMKTLKKKLVVIMMFAFASSASCRTPGDTAQRPILPGDLNAAQALVADMGFGVNIGNTLDAIGHCCWRAGETGWGNPPITRDFISALRTHGFRTVRLPVTWAEYIGLGPDYLIEESRMARVEEVVNWILEEDMYVILNMHHDGGNIGPINGGLANVAWILHIADRDEAGYFYREEEIIGKFASVWKQIAQRFRDTPDKLLFQSMNEIGFDTLWNRWAPGQTAQKAEAYRLLNRLNQTFVDTVRATGGGNAERFLVVQGYWTDIQNTVDPLFQMPTDTVTYRLILSIHYYTPWDFIVPWYFPHARRDWGTIADREQLRQLFNLLRIPFLDRGIPIILGEFMAGRVIADTQREEYRFLWIDAVTRTALDLGIAPVFWEIGSQHPGPHGMGDINRRYPFEMSETFRRVMEPHL